jgi:hypothetical protein
MSDETLIPFTITRSKWLRGGKGNSYLLRIDGLMCCLGMWCKQIADIPEADMLSRTSPQMLRGHVMQLSQRFPWLLTMRGNVQSALNTSRANDLMEDNDCPYISQEERERRIAEGFAKLGYRVIFED